MNQDQTTQAPPPTQVDPIMQHFALEDLPPAVAVVAKPFSELAAHIAATLPRNAERTVALRKLLESLDSAIRASR